MLDILKLLLQKFILSCFEKKQKINPLNKNVKNATILIVDDSVVFTKILTMFSKVIGIQYIYVKNGKEAIESFEYFFFDIVLTDIDMPEINGLQLIKYIRKQSNVPIIATSSNKKYEENALYNGANVFISKPFRYSDFYKNITTLLPNYSFDKIAI